MRYVKLRKDKAEIKYSGTDYNLEVFHMHEKQIPVDGVEIKETIHAFAWELAGSKFAVIHGEPPSTSVSFYEVKTGQTPTLLKKYERKACNQLYWAPSGIRDLFQLFSMFEHLNEKFKLTIIVSLLLCQRA